MKRSLRLFLVFIWSHHAVRSAARRSGTSLDAEYPIVIRHIIDPRLPSLSEAEFQDMLDRCKGYIYEYLGYRVSFFVQGNQGIQAFREETKSLDDLPMMRELKKSLLDIDNKVIATAWRST